MFFNNAGYVWNYLHDKSGNVTILYPEEFTSNKIVSPLESNGVFGVQENGWQSLVSGNGNVVPFIRFRVPRGYPGVLGTAYRKVGSYLSAIPAGMDMHGSFSYWVVIPSKEAPEFIGKMPFCSIKERNDALKSLSFYRKILKPTVDKCFALAVMETTVNNSVAIPLTRKPTIDSNLCGKNKHSTFTIFTIDEAKNLLMESREKALEILE